MNKKRKTEGFMYIIVAKRRNTKIMLMNKLLFFGTITFISNFLLEASEVVEGN